MVSCVVDANFAAPPDVFRDSTNKNVLCICTFGFVRESSSEQFKGAIVVESKVPSQLDLRSVVW